MGKRLKLLALFLALLILSLSFSWRPRTLCRGFLPENNLKIPVGEAHALGINEDIFNSVIDRAEKIYAPIIAAHGGKLLIFRNWENPLVNAYAQRAGPAESAWIVTFYGGLARHPGVTPEGFALVVCHELGHHLGGFPKFSSGYSLWASTEGEADYFATLKCLRNVFPGDSAPEGADPYAAKACEKVYPQGQERNLCLSNILAGMSVGKLFHPPQRQDPLPAFNTPDPSVVDVTYEKHPPAQCRLDTVFQGALCAKPASEDMSATSPAPGACTASQGYKQGMRPLCWYHAAQGDALLPSQKNLSARLESLRGALSGL